MLTPQEVSEHAFAKASFGGYNMAMVDEFLDVLTADYTTLYKENATLLTIASAERRPPPGPPPAAPPGCGR